MQIESIRKPFKSTSNRHQKTFANFRLETWIQRLVFQKLQSEKLLRPQNLSPQDAWLGGNQDAKPKLSVNIIECQGGLKFSRPAFAISSFVNLRALKDMKYLVRAFGKRITIVASSQGVYFCYACLQEDLPEFTFHCKKAGLWTAFLLCDVLLCELQENVCIQSAQIAYQCKFLCLEVSLLTPFWILRSFALLSQGYFFSSCTGQRCYESSAELDVVCSLYIVH